MNEEKRDKVALMRYAVIAPLINSASYSGKSIKDLLDEAASREYVNPDGKVKHFSASTIEKWLYLYRKDGFESLRTLTRKDCGSSRKIDSDIYESIKYLKIKYPRIPATEIYRQLLLNGDIRKDDLSLSTVTRCVNKIVEEQKLPVHTDMRRYERPHINEVWCGDSCVGPKVMIEGAKRRIYIIALIDDASRYITGAMAFYQDDFASLMQVMKSAVMKFGVPKMLNFDNGHSYKNLQMELLAARIGTVIHYDHPYSPTEKSKIERWFRTMRDKWLGITDLRDFNSIDDVQKSLDLFVQNYNHTVHSSLNGKTPDERFFSESELIRRLTSDEIEKDFLFEIERRVSADSVITINNTEYEVDCRYSGTRIRLRYSSDMKTIFVVESDGSLIPVKLLNKQENSTIKRNKVYLTGGNS